MSAPVVENEQSAPNQSQPAGSLRRRYAYKLIANLAGMLMNFLIQALIPRALGPKAYGDYCFITNSFSQLTGFLDMGTSTAFYTKLSQRPDETGLVRFYAGFGAIITAVLLGFVSVAALTPASGLIWPGQQYSYLVLGAIWGIMTWVVQVVSQMTDAYGVTIQAEVAKTIQKTVALGLILLLFALQSLNLTWLFCYQFAVMLLLIGHLIYIMQQQGCLQQQHPVSRQEIRAYIAEFYIFSHPLVVSTIVVLLVGLFDRWFLQLYAGSVQQGFFGLSYQIGSICFLFSSAMIPLLAREFSVAFGVHDIPQMATLFRRYVPLLCALSAFFSCFVMIQAHNIVLIYSGRAFSGAVVAVQIMAIFPIHQTYGQLTSSVLYATGQTRLYRNIGIATAVAGIPLTWFLVAPVTKLGMDLGATGLALKVLIITVLAVNIQLYCTTRLLKLPFAGFIRHQIASIALFTAAAWLIDRAVSMLVSGANQHYYQFLLSGMLYTLSIAALSYRLPVLLGLTRADITDLLSRLKKLVPQQQTP